jgi:ATP-dependent protease HslVU (ClpYQ) peptidase subunit
MTVLVVVRKADKVVIAADTTSSHGSTLLKADYKNNHEKIIRFKNTWFALTGYSMGKLMLAHALEDIGDDLSFNGLSEVYRSSLKLHKHFKDEYFLMTKNGGSSQAVESTQLPMLIANSSGAYEVGGDRNVVEIAKFWAAGSGMRFALGAMHSAYDRYKDPAKIAQAGIEAACEFDSACELPMILHQCTLKAE